MTAQATKPTKKSIPQPKERKRKFNRKRVLNLAISGVTPTQIAVNQHVHPATIIRYLDSIGLNHQELSRYKATRADLKALIGMKAEAKQLEVIESIDVNAMSDSSKNGLLMALNAIDGTRYQEERLERGQSTANIAYDARSINTALAALREEVEQLKVEDTEYQEA